MATLEQITAAKELLEQRWDAQGECRSCGWHACLYEHYVCDEQIAGAIDHDDGMLYLGCLNEPDEGHRGVTVNLNP